MTGKASILLNRRATTRVWAVRITVLGVLIGGATYLGWRLLSGETPADGRRPTATATGEARPASGAGREVARLRDGARQIEDPASASAVAREALARVEAELASAGDDAERQRLQRKKDLIEQAIARLETAGAR